MKILLIHSRYRIRGGEETVLDQEYALLKKGNRVERLYFDNRGGWCGAFQFLTSIWNLRAASRVRKKIAEFRPDVVHLHNWHFATGPLVIRTIRKTGVPLVVTLHNYRLLCPSATLLHKGRLFLKSLKQGFPWSAVVRGVYRKSRLQTFWLAFIVRFHRRIGTWTMPDKYIVLTEFSKKLYVDSGFVEDGDKFVVKRNFSAPCRTDHSSEKRDFLFVGRLSVEKGLYTLLEVFAQHAYKLTIIGDGPLKEEVAKISQNNPGIKYVGKLDKESVIKYMQRASALLFPSVWHETFGLVITEAFSVGTPVIGANMGSVPFLVQDDYNGLLFEAGNPDSLRDAIEKWNAKSEEEKQRFGANAYSTYLDNYTPERNKELLVAIYREVISGYGGANVSR